MIPTSDPAVPLSHALGNGTVGQLPNSGTAGGTVRGTPSLKALASKVLARDSGRDETWDTSKSAVPGGSKITEPVGHLSRPDSDIEKPFKWEAETQALIDWFLSETAPTEPFELQPGVYIATPGPWWETIRKDIAAGRSGARWRAVPHDLKKLYALFGPDIEREAIMNEEFFPGTKPNSPERKLP